MVAWGPREVNWSPSHQVDVTAKNIKPGDIVQNSTLSSWWKIDSVDRSTGTIEMTGYQVMGADAKGKPILGRTSGKLSALPNEVRTVGFLH